MVGSVGVLLARYECLADGKGYQSVKFGWAGCAVSHSTRCARAIIYEHRVRTGWITRAGPNSLTCGPRRPDLDSSCIVASHACNSHVIFTSTDSLAAVYDRLVLYHPREAPQTVVVRAIIQHVSTCSSILQPVPFCLCMQQITLSIRKKDAAVSNLCCLWLFRGSEDESKNFPCTAPFMALCQFVSI